MSAMTRTEALQLAQRVLDHWPDAHLSLDAWADLLADCEHAVATAVLKRMRDSFTTAPSIPDFRVQYRGEIDRRDRDRDDLGGRPRSCEQCSGAGVNGEEYLIIGGERGEREGWAVEYRIPIPCRCSAGARFPRSNPPDGVEYRYSATPLERPPVDPTVIEAAQAAFEEAS